MRFTASLQFNAVPEWTDNYLKYSSLKKILHSIERARWEAERLEGERARSKERGDDSAGSPVTLDEVMSAKTACTRLENSYHDAFTRDLKFVDDFYMGQRADLLSECKRLKEASTSSGSTDASVPHTPISTSEEKISSEAAEEQALPVDLSSKNISKLFVALCDLSDFAEMNWNGYNKLLQKYEGMAAEVTSAVALRLCLDKSHLKNLNDINASLKACEELWVQANPDVPREEAIKQLNELRRERLAFERATVWKELVREQRKIMAVEPVAHKAAAKGGHGHHHGPSPVKQAIVFLVVALIIGAFTRYDIVKMPAGSTDEQKTTARGAAALLLSTIVLWMFEPIPLYITTFYIPLMGTILKVIPQTELHGFHATNKEALTAHEAVQYTVYTSKAILGHFFSDNILILLAGFAMSSALDKYGVTTGVASTLLNNSSKKPKYVILLFMFMAAIFSAVISNVAASILCFGLLAPILKSRTADDPFAKAIILSIAYAANVGGLTSPIASAQDVVGFGTMLDDDQNRIGFGMWCVYALPVTIIGIFACWFVLLSLYKLPSKDITFFGDSSEKKVTPTTEKAKKKGKIFVTVVALLTIVLFVCSSALEKYVGKMGTLAFVPLALYFGFGILGKDDFNTFMWNVPALAMGGSAIGFCVDKSGLLKIVGTAIQGYTTGKSHFVTIFVFSFITLIATTFISHTVGAIILLPIVKDIAMQIKNASGPQYPTALFVNIVILTVCFCTSAGMGLPISGFPNINAVAQEDATGRPFVSTMDFVKTGLLSSVLVWLAIYLEYVVLYFLYTKVPATNLLFVNVKKDLMAH